MISCNNCGNLVYEQNIAYKYVLINYISKQFKYIKVSAKNNINNNIEITKNVYYKDFKNNGLYNCTYNYIICNCGKLIGYSLLSINKNYENLKFDKLFILENIKPIIIDNKEKIEINYNNEDNNKSDHNINNIQKNVNSIIDSDTEINEYIKINKENINDILEYLNDLNEFTNGIIKKVSENEDKVKKIFEELEKLSYIININE